MRASNKFPTSDSVSLREYVDARFMDQEKAVQSALVAQKEAVASALAAAKEAVTKAEIASDKRFEGVNEFRAALNDNARLLMPRAEFEQSMKSLQEKIDTLNARQDAKENQAKGSGQNWVIIGAAVAFAASVFSIIFTIARHTQ